MITSPVSQFYVIYDEKSNICEKLKKSVFFFFETQTTKLNGLLPSRFIKDDLSGKTLEDFCKNEHSNSRLICQ